MQHAAGRDNKYLFPIFLRHRVRMLRPAQTL